MLIASYYEHMIRKFLRRTAGQLRYDISIVRDQKINRKKILLPPSAS